jgi:hypothetical protein
MRLEAPRLGLVTLLLETGIQASCRQQNILSDGACAYANHKQARRVTGDQERGKCV